MKHEMSSKALLEERIDKALARAWSQLNDAEITGTRALPMGRISGKSKLETGYYSLLKQDVSRLSVSWLVDGAPPNPVYFRQPRVQDVIPFLNEAGVSLYEGTPLVNQSLLVTVDSVSDWEQLRVGVQNAWRKANPVIRQDYFYVLVDAKSAKKSRDSSSIAVSKREDKSVGDNVLYFIGIQDKSFDASEIQQPTLKLIQEEVKRLVPGVRFADDKTIEFVKVDSNDNKNINKDGDENAHINIFDNNNNNNNFSKTPTRKTKQIPVSSSSILT